MLAYPVSPTSVAHRGGGASLRGLCLAVGSSGSHEQRHRRNDRRRDDEGFEDVQRDAGGQAAPRPRAREHHGGQQGDEGQVLETQQAHADREGCLDDVDREEKPGGRAQELAH